MDSFVLQVILKTIILIKEHLIDHLLIFTTFISLNAKYLLDIIYKIINILFISSLNKRHTLLKLL